MANTQRIKSVVEFIEKRAVNFEGTPSRQGKLFFDMNQWYTQFTPEDVEAYNKYGEEPPKECGTYMCFAGWAYYKVKGRKAFEANAISIYNDQPYFDNEVIPEWATKYFGLTEEEAYMLFDSEGAIEVNTIEGLKARINLVLGEDVFDLPAIV